MLHNDVPHPKLNFGELLHRRNSRNLQVRAQEVDLIGEYTLTHGVTIEVEVGDRVATQLPTRRPLGYLPRELLGRFEVAFGYAHQQRHPEPMSLVAGPVAHHADETTGGNLVALQ